jgi:dethiobiotin synthetase
MIPHIMNKIVITGTDTEIGKTAFSAALMLGLEATGAQAHYWKPIQSGVAEGTDTNTVKDLTGLPDKRFLPERYIFKNPLSPHRAAELDNAQIDMDDLSNPENIPACEDTLIIEGAGGLFVPTTRSDLQIDLYNKWQIPVVLCARTGLGTINHTLLSIEALKSRNIPIKGIVLIGEENTDNTETIAAFSRIDVLGIMPKLEQLSRNNLIQVFATHFNPQDFI